MSHEPPVQSAMETKILTAGAELIADIGPDISLNDVADRAGVSRMSVYRNIGNREDLIRAVLLAEFRRLLTTAQATERTGNGRQQLCGLCAAMATELAANDVYRNVFAGEPQTIAPLMTQRFGSSQQIALTLLADEISKGIADSSIRAIDNQVAALSCLLAIQSVVWASPILTESDQLEQAITEMTVMLDHYLQEVA